MMLRYQANLLKEHVNTFLGSLLLCTVAFWAGLTIWDAATGNNPVVHALEKAIVQQQEMLSN